MPIKEWSRRYLKLHTKNLVRKGGETGKEGRGKKNRPQCSAIGKDSLSIRKEAFLICPGLTELKMPPFEERGGWSHA